MPEGELTQKRVIAFLREALALLALFAAACFSLPAAAQPAKPLPAVGVLWKKQAAVALEPFREGLRGRGWIDGRTVRLIERFDDGDPAKLAALAAELASLPVDVLYVADDAVAAARKATTTIPIVCPDFYDPVAQGFLTNMARPEGNITGISWQSTDTGIKRLELLRELVPGLRRVALLFDPSATGPSAEARILVQAAKRLGIEAFPVEIRRTQDLPKAFDRIEELRPGALMVSINPLLVELREEIGRRAIALRLPFTAELHVFAEAGAVVTYGPAQYDSYARAAHLVDRILRGAKPGDIPVEQPTRFSMMLNAAAAKALGLSIPPAMLMRAWRVIE